MKKNVTSLKDLEKRFNDDKDGLKTIVSALEYLKEEAARSKLDDIEMIIDCAFKLCLSIYCLQLRGDYIAAEDPNLN